MYKLAFAFSLCFAGSCLADAQACRELAEKTPAILSDMPVSDIHDYEKSYPGLGFSVMIEGPETKVSIFFYDNQEDRISAGLVRVSFEEAIDEMQIASDQKNRNLRQLTKEPASKQVGFVQHVAKGISGEQTSEVLGLGIVQDCIVKIRITSIHPMRGVRGVLDYFSERLSLGFE